MESANRSPQCDICGKTFLHSLSRHKKLHNDLTKPREMCKKCIRCERMDNYKGIQVCPKKPTATAAAAAEKPRFDYVPCDKSFSKIHFVFMIYIS